MELECIERCVPGYVFVYPRHLKGDSKYQEYRTQVLGKRC